MTHNGRNDRPGMESGGSQSESDLDRQLEGLFQRLSVENAPASLRRRLRRIYQLVRSSMKRSTPRAASTTR